MHNAAFPIALLIVAVILFAIAAVWNPAEAHRHRFIAAGLVFFAASFLLGRF